MAFERRQQSSVRINSMSLVKQRFKYDLRKFNFTNRVCNVWNSLSEYVVTAPTIDVFKGRLDAHWQFQEMIYDWSVELHGTGSRSHV